MSARIAGSAWLPDQAVQLALPRVRTLSFGGVTFWAGSFTSTNGLLRAQIAIFEPFGYGRHLCRAVPVGGC
jgi:hypothetical protein